MITFNYTDHPNGQVSIEVRSHAVHIGALVDDFKMFLSHVGHHPENVERVVFFEKEDRQALPMQLDMFKDAP